MSLLAIRLPQSSTLECTYLPTFHPDANMVLKRRPMAPEQHAEFSNNVSNPDRDLGLGRSRPGLRGRVSVSGTAVNIREGMYKTAPSHADRA